MARILVGNNYQLGIIVFIWRTIKLEAGFLGLIFDIIMRLIYFTVIIKNHTKDKRRGECFI